MESSLSPTELAARLTTESSPHLLDVRDVEEHQFVALPGSKLIPLREIPQRVDEIEPWKNEEIVVYCHHGIRSQHAIGWLRQQGFTKLRNLTGGIDRWTSEVDPSLPRY
jgi:rhodanese-related sulfurtransferase